MTTFFTSDTHFGHQRIIELCNRPFGSVDEMNDAIVERWNAVVSPDDVVYHLGDVALGKIADSLPQVGRLNGYKILVEGNHDRPFMDKRKPEKYARWVKEYLGYFDEIHANNAHTFGFGTRNEVTALLSHFPYDGDSHGEDRYAEDRLLDHGWPLIHGHTHDGGDPIAYSDKGTLQIHVGQDAWDYTPVSEHEVYALLAGSL